MNVNFNVVKLPSSHYRVPQMGINDNFFKQINTLSTQQGIISLNFVAA